MSWQHGRQPASFSRGNVAATYTYNSDGIRTSKTVGGVTTTYTNVDGSLRLMTDGTNTLQFLDSSVLFNGTEYWYVKNAQNDIIGLIDENGTYVVEYTYDAWGNPLSKTGSLADTLGTLNPYRYRGYIYDEETGLYYVSSRYYDSVIGRFLNEDAFVSTGQGIIGHNMFAYCNNNPIMHIDPTGECTVAWSKGYQGPCPGQGKPGCMDNYLSVQDDPTPRDVTQEVNEVLFPTAHGCYIGRSLGLGATLLIFYNMVNHGEEWDIKLEDSWNETIGTPYPGFDTPIVYNGEEMTPQGLGNYTYGYLGAAFGIPLQILHGGSYVAAGFPIAYDQLSHEVGEDWKYVTKGYIAAKWEGVFGWC